ncbi:MAG: hypothetical protein FJ387_00830 [Verrucomicrobia bacterium]|nr:hypothetical protein [Verrucomicrobiota bacterium]
MRAFAATSLVFLTGFAIMVLEIIGARYLAKDFGSSFYVWTSQIGMVLVALALGYALGGVLADRHPRTRVLGHLLLPAGLLTALIPSFAPRLLNAIILRHPLGTDIPLLWQKLDPALGSAVIFLLPCLALAAAPPFLIRWATQRVAHVGQVSGQVFAASTTGSIAGVFVSGYVLIDVLSLSEIFQATGALVALIGLACWSLDRWLSPSPAT